MNFNCSLKYENSHTFSFKVDQGKALENLWKNLSEDLCRAGKKCQCFDVNLSTCHQYKLVAWQAEDSKA